MARLGMENLGLASRWILIASLVGLAAGLAAVAFQHMIHAVRDVALSTGTPFEGEGLRIDGWSTALVLAIPALGAFLAAWIGLRVAPDAAGHGTEQVIETFHQREGVVRKRAVAVKAVASALTIGSGGSGGGEGPITHIGGGIGSVIADAFRLPRRERRLFFITGASAGIGALFCAPLGGALFGPEVLYRKPEFEGEAIIPCIIASIVGYTVRTTLTGESRVVTIAGEIRERLVFDDWRHLALYLALGLACALVSLIYVRTFHAVHTGFDKLGFLTKPQRAGLGGLLLGVLALAIAPFVHGQGVFFGGYGLMRGAIATNIGVWALLLLMFAKIVATSLTIGSGGSGGMFAPSLAIGALLGAAVGHAAAALFPGLNLEPASFAFVGMGGFFAGVAKTPIAAIIIVSEMTGSYGLLAPLMLVSVLHLLLASRWTLYESQVQGIVDSPAHAGEFVVDVLAGMRVKDLLDRFSKPTLVSESATLRKALDIVASSRSTYFPVVDRETRLVGIFGLTDIRRIFQEDDVADLVIVRDFMVEDVVTVTPEDSLNDALQRLNDRMIAQLPVVAADNPRKVLGMLSRNNLGAAYHQKMRELRRTGTA
jgi:CIC family chloride channel protein